jgi:hypothetical protein
VAGVTGVERAKKRASGAVEDVAVVVAATEVLGEALAAVLSAVELSSEQPLNRMKKGISAPSRQLRRQEKVNLVIY